MFNLISGIGSSFPKQSLDQRSKIEAVLFTLWAQGHLERSITASTVALPFARMVQALTSLLFLPADVLRCLPEIVLAATIAVLSVSAFESPYSIKGEAVFVITLMLLLKDRLIRIFKCIFFDIVDFISLSALSRRYAKLHLALGPLTTHKDIYGLKEHLYVSRILTSGSYCAESDAFLELVLSPPDNLDIQFEIKQYWQKFPVEQNYWQELLLRPHKVE